MAHSRPRGADDLRSRRQPAGGRVHEGRSRSTSGPRFHAQGVCMSLRVREAGLQSLVVDFGRERSRALGVPVGGAADRAALTLGNALVGNEPPTPALEVAFAGPTLEALHPTACVIFGTPFQSTVNGEAIAPGVTFTLEAGDVLRVGGTAEGAR